MLPVLVFSKKNPPQSRSLGDAWAEVNTILCPEVPTAFRRPLTYSSVEPLKRNLEPGLIVRTKPASTERSSLIQ